MDQGSIPRKVAPGLAEARAGSLKSRGMAGALARLMQMGFAVPTALGYGDHWQLGAADANALGLAMAECVEVLPQRRKAAAIKTMAEWLPWVSLASVAYMVVYPRVIQTQMQRRGAVVGHAHGPRVGAANPGGAVGGADGTTPTAAVSVGVSPDVAAVYRSLGLIVN